MKFIDYPRFLVKPKDPDRVRALEARREELPNGIRTRDQAIGKYVVGCGATHGVHERCNFGCTACYLSDEANRQKPLAFDEVREQLEHLRAYLGPGGNVQITSGEVTLLPAEHLVRIVKTARDLALSPMVMTHGDVLIHDPDYLVKLVADGGLQKISFHVDTTQRGRIGYARPTRERELDPVRDRIANLLLEVRRRTGVKLKAAMTLTINRENIDQIGDVTDWFMANLDRFRLLSFQPQAKTGRTRLDNGVSSAQVWQRIERALGRKLNGHPFLFGHEACTRFTLLLALETDKKRIVLEFVQAGNDRDRRLVSRFFADFGGVVMSDRGPVELAFKILGMLIRKPIWLPRIISYAVTRAWRERAHAPAVLAALFRLKLRVRPFVFVIHSFMSREELETDLGRERLAACVFKLPVNGKMVSMCQMNATEIRESTYQV